MDRAQLAHLLGYPESGFAQKLVAPLIVDESDPRRFMSKFAEAVAGSGEVFLGNPAWGQKEQAELKALLSQQPATLGSGRESTGWLCIPTGGTGGRLKFARHDERTIAAAVRGFTQHFRVNQVNTVGVLPLFHVSGLMAWCRCALTGGGYRPFDWKAIESGELPSLDEKLTGWMISLVPTQLERLLRQPAASGWLKQFRIIFVGGAPTSPALLEQAASLGLPLSLGYGMTETAAMVTALSPEEFLAGARDCGRAMPHAEVRIGSEGVIQIASESLFRGYYPERAVTTWFETADGGCLDANGHLRVMGRRDAVIISGGEKIAPNEVESALRESGNLSEVVVLGMPDPEWGHLVVAAYPGNVRLDRATLDAFLSRLAPAKRPKRYVPLPEWPRLATGKTDRAEVARLVECHLQKP